jgi:hypothetical protein
MSLPRVLLVALQCAEVFEQGGVGYFLGGSLASSMQGEPRSTNDIDFVVDLRHSQVESLARALEADFDIDVESLKEAALRRGSWNIYHLQTLIKVDLFMLRLSPFDQSEFSRRHRMVVTPDGRGLYIKSAPQTLVVPARRRALHHAVEGRRPGSAGVGRPAGHELHGDMGREAWSGGAADSRTS